jgi:hypothetical protein
MTNPDTGDNSCIEVTIDGTIMHVPLSNDNTTYVEIQRMVSVGDLVIQDAD